MAHGRQVVRICQPKGGEKPESTVADAPVEDVDRRPFFDGGKNPRVLRCGLAWKNSIENSTES